MSNDNQPIQDSQHLFLYIPIFRLVFLSFFSLGLYDAYWIYKNWWYLQKRYKLDISPFWRGWFGIFFCHSLLRKIHEDPEANVLQKPDFSPSSWATAWVITHLSFSILGIFENPIIDLLNILIPTTVFFIPAQQYINSIEEVRNPGQSYHSWSSIGHFLCLLYGVFIWGIFFIGLLAYLK